MRSGGGVVVRHRRDGSRIRRHGTSRQPQATAVGAGKFDGHHASAVSEPRADTVKARRPRGTRGRSEAQRLDGAEHGSTLKRVMAEREIHRHLLPRMTCANEPEIVPECVSGTSPACARDSPHNRTAGRASSRKEPPCEPVQQRHCQPRRERPPLAAGRTAHPVKNGGRSRHGTPH